MIIRLPNVKYNFITVNAILTVINKLTKMARFLTIENNMEILEFIEFLSKETKYRYKFLLGIIINKDKLFTDKF